MIARNSLAQKYGLLQLHWAGMLAPLRWSPTMPPSSRKLLRSEFINDSSGFGIYRIPPCSVCAGSSNRLFYGGRAYVVQYHFDEHLLVICREFVSFRRDP